MAGPTSTNNYQFTGRENDNTSLYYHRLGTTASCSTDLLAKMLSVFGGWRHQPLRLRTTSCNSHARSPGNEAKPVANLTAAGHPDRSESGVSPALVHTPTENDLVC